MSLLTHGRPPIVARLSPEESRERRELQRLLSMPGQNGTTTLLPGPPTQFVDGPSFAAQYGEIWKNHIYRFEATRADPTILDCGANVGVGTLFWKQLFPRSEIVAFEPDAAIFRVLTANLAAWKMDGVHPVNAAVWTQEGEAPFWAEGADSGRLVPPPSGYAWPEVSVRTVRLRDYLDQPIEFLKLDIEGAEAPVLVDCRDRLGQVEHVFVEYHSLIGQPQPLDEIVAVLRSTGFRFYAQPQLLIPSPFLNHLNYKGLDQTINIFAWRENS